MTDDQYDLEAPGEAGISAAAEKAWDAITGPEPDAIDQALATLRAARKILADAGLMKAIRRRLDEGRRAVAEKDAR